MRTLKLDPDRFFPVERATRAIARELFAKVEHLPLLSPHGHADAGWFAGNEPFEDPVSLLLWPDHYLLRMLYSQGVGFGELGLAGGSGSVQRDRRSVWRLFAKHYYLYRGTPSRIWLDHTFAEVFGLTTALDETTADSYYDQIETRLAEPAFRPRALYERFNIEALATTEGATDTLAAHAAIAASGWGGRVITTFRPDDVVDASRADFLDNLAKLEEQTGESVSTWRGYLAAIARRREFFRRAGATASDHGHPTAATADLNATECQRLLDRIRRSDAGPEDHELFRAQMLTEMAAMSCDDGLVMQLHPGSWRNHNPELFARYGRDRGADIPTAISYVDALKPLLDRFGNRADFTLILFTLDESTYSRELAPLAGHYPCLRLGPAWWFHDSVEGMLRYRRHTTESAGFYNTVGFNDDTRAFLSVPARHDLARRIDCSYLAELVATHRLERDEAAELAHDLSYALVKRAYRL